MALAVEKKVERLVASSEAAGRTVARVIVEGNKIELVYDKGQDDKDAFDLVDFAKNETRTAQIRLPQKG